MSPLIDRACTLLRRLGTDRSGFSAVLTALALTMLMGFVGLGVDVGMWQWLQRQMQEAADHAAFAAAQSQITLYDANQSATQSSDFTSTPTETGLSVALAGLNLGGTTFTQSSSSSSGNSGSACYVPQPGSTAANNNVQICISYGPAVGTGNNYAWQAAISQTRPMWFSRILFSTAGTIGATAIAQPNADPGEACVLAVAPTSTAASFAINGGNSSAVPSATGTASVTLTNCDALVSSNNSTGAIETGGTAYLSALNIYVGGAEINGGITFAPGPGAAQNYADLSPNADYLSIPTNSTVGDPYVGRAAVTPTGTGGHSGNNDGCDYYAGDAPLPLGCPYGASGCTAPSSTQPWYVNTSDGPGIYCPNPQDPGVVAGGNPQVAYIPQDGVSLTQGQYILWGVGMQLPSSSATMSYTCQNSSDTYDSTTGTCNNGAGVVQADTPTAQCTGGGVNATNAVEIYVLPKTVGATTYNTGQVQLAPATGTKTCFAISAPKYTQMTSSLGPPPTLGWVRGTNYSSALPTSGSGRFVATGIEGIAIWVAYCSTGSTCQMSRTPIDYLGSTTSGTTSNIAINGVFYDPGRTVELANSSTSGTCSQIDAQQVQVIGPATLNLRYCTYTGQTYLSTPAYNYLGPVTLYQ